ncbi:DUF3194 domain-containing protein [Halomarina rubra]|uniref:DUF3194 domain-containing protein n=1 Tax=Halomarina rubra TaxID=2071873 RepID=A0ABD6AQ81_9EURY|nr:DUF3194 domain-containing protein [Halomarina rubra]
MPTEADREPTDEEVVQTASDAAEGVVLSRYKQSEVRDVDVTVHFEDGTLSVDVYLDAPGDAEAVADEAALAARSAVDDLFAEAEADADAN